MHELLIDRCENLTDEGIQKLASFPALEFVAARGLSVDETVYESLRTRRPELSIRIRRRAVIAEEDAPDAANVDAEPMT